MDQKTLDKLPLPTSSFPELRAGGQIYVDKTDLIYTLASGRNRIFLSRPRRFGKSLLVTTFASLFKNGLEYFADLEIAKLWKDTTYPVIQLDFSKVGKFADEKEFAKKLASVFRRAFATAKIPVTGQSYEGIIEAFDIWLTTARQSEVVLLVDEYDSPLTQCLNSPDLFDHVRDSLTDFYSLVKSNDGAWRFVFITGIAKFAKMNIFSGMNNLRDISLLRKYGSLLGYTEEELESYFDVYLDRASGIQKMDRRMLLATMKRKYDGFCFESTGQIKVYSPWSVLNFLTDPEEGFKNYWYQSGGQPSILTQYIDSHFFNDPRTFFSPKEINEVDLSLSIDSRQLNELALLTQTGYLTIESSDGSNLLLNYPNAEVKESIAQLYVDGLLNSRKTIPGSEKFKKCVCFDPAENIVQEFNRLILGLDYMAAKDISESQIAALFQISFVIAGFEPKVESHNALGRSDLEVDLGSRYLVVEFKIKQENQTIEEALQGAVEQVVDKKYGMTHSDQQLLRIAMVYVRPKDESEEDRGIFHWRLVASSKDGQKGS